VQTPCVFLTAIMGQTLLPAMSRIQNDPARMNRVLLQATSAVVMLGLPALVFVGFCGHSLLTLIYGPRYGVVSAALATAAAASFINVLNVLITIAFYATGKPQLHRRAVAAMAVVVLALVYPLSKGLGIWAGQLACLVAIVIGYLLQVERIRKVTCLRLAEYFKSFLIPAAASLLIAVLWLAIRYFGALTQPAPTIIFGLLGCLLAYGLAGAMFSRAREAV
jgi:O-antigen/teichoic acid export membrane protein